MTDSNYTAALKKISDTRNRVDEIESSMKGLSERVSNAGMRALLRCCVSACFNALGGTGKA
jgi:hypothetical protein